MPVAETVVISLGVAVAKTILKLWLKDSAIAQDIAMSSTAIFEKVLPSILERHKAAGQFKHLEVAIATKFTDYIEAEYATLPANEKEAAVQAAADTLNGASLAQLLVKSDLDPVELERHLQSTDPDAKRDLSRDARSLYDFIIREASNYLIDAAASLPDFHLETTRALLRGDREVLEILRRVLENRPPPMWKDDEFERRYRLMIARKLDELELFAFDPASPFSRYPLSVAYITLTAGPTSPEVRGRTAPTYLRVDKILAGSSKVLILGQAGSGKTTLLQWLAVGSARREFDGALVDWNDTVPFFLQLRQYHNQELPGPEAFVNRIAASISELKSQDWVHQQLANGRALVLVDGVDELPQAARRDVRVWLADLTTEFPKARYIVTSRPAAVRDDWFEYHGFTHSELQLMTRADIMAFIRHWHEAVSAEPHSRALAQLTRRQLEAVIIENQPLRRLATNPLLCGIICALHREQGIELPRRRMELYRMSLDSLLRERDVQRGVPREVNLSLGDTKVLLQYLAWWLITNDSQEASADEVLSRLRTKLGMMPHLKGLEPTKVLNHLLIRSGVLREPVKGSIDFIHRTFQDYLGAKEAIVDDAVGQLVRNGHRDQWHEVIVLAAGHANRHQRKKLITGLLRRGDHENRYRHRLHLLAVGCMETSPEIDPDVQKEIVGRIENLIPPRTMSDAVSLASAGELAVGPVENRGRALQHGQRQRDRANVTAACIRTLALVGADTTLDTVVTALRYFARDERFRVVRELVRTWGLFDPVGFATEVMVLSPLEQGDLEIRDPMLVSAARHLPRLQSLHCQFSGRVEDLGFLRGAKDIETLDISATRVADLGPLRDLATPDKLHWLNINGCALLADMEPVAALSQLNVCHASYCPGIHDLSALSDLDKIRHLFIRQSAYEDLGPIGGLYALRTLAASGSKGVKDLAPLRTLASLEILDLADCAEIKDLASLNGLRRLAELDLSNCYRVTDLSPLAGLSRMTNLVLAGCTALTDISALSGMRSIVRLNLAECRCIRDLSPLRRMDNLSSLTLAGCTEIVDLTPLADLSSLTELDLRGTRDDLEVPLDESKVRVVRDGSSNTRPLGRELETAAAEWQDLSDVCPRCQALVYYPQRQCYKCGATLWAEKHAWRRQ